MKTWISLLLGAASLACAEDIKVGDDEYKSVKILSRTGEIVTLETDSGLARISIAKLPEKFRRAHELLTDADRQADAVAEHLATIAAERARVASLTPTQRAAEDAKAEAEKSERAARLKAHQDAEIKVAMEESEALAAKLKADEEIRSLSRINAKVIQVLPEGLLVERRISRGPAVSGLGRIGGASFGGGELPASDQNRGEEIYGTFLVVGHPKAKDKVDEDRIDVDAKQTGVFSFVGVDGASHTVKKFKVVKTVE